MRQWEIASFSFCKIDRELYLFLSNFHLRRIIVIICQIGIVPLGSIGICAVDFVDV